MLGLQIKIASNSKESLLAALEEVVRSIQVGDSSSYMLLPINNKDSTEVDYFIVEDILKRYGPDGVFEDWYE